MGRQGVLPVAKRQGDPAPTQRGRIDAVDHFEHAQVGAATGGGCKSLPLHERARRVNKAGMHTSLFEALMLACFSVSWFFSIARSLRSRSTGGKSIWFLWIIFTGYCAGCVHKVLNNRDWVLFLYVFNNTMVFTDILLYFRNRLFERRACAAAGANADG